MGGVDSVSRRCLLQSLLVSLQVNREIVSGLKYIQHTFRKGVKSKCFSVTQVLLCVRAFCSFHCGDGGSPAAAPTARNGRRQPSVMSLPLSPWRCVKASGSAAGWQPALLAAPAPLGLMCNPRRSAAVNRSLLTAVLAWGDRSLQEEPFLE